MKDGGEGRERGGKEEKEEGKRRRRGRVGGGGGRRRRRSKKANPTWDLEVEVAGAADSGDGGRLLPACDALLNPPLTCHLHREGAPCGTQLPQGPITPWGS